MTVELLDKGTELNKEIKELEDSLRILCGYKGRHNKSLFFVKGVYEIKLPSEITDKIEMLAEIELKTLLEQKKKQFEELGKQ